jgi:hypothetical protein
MLNRVSLFTACVLLAGLCACSGAGTSPTPAAVSAATNSAMSWIDSKASKGTLLYVSDPGAKTVAVFAFPKGRRIGTLKGFTQPMGECVDTSGNLYVTDEGASKIFEYAHGKSKPIQTIDTTPYKPYGCAANLHGGDQTGYFASINAPDANDPSGSVTILGARHGLGQLSMRQFSSVGYICYDEHTELANLWVDGLNATGAFQMAAFSPHRRKFNVVPFPNVLKAPGDVWWDGKLLDVADQDGPSGTSALSQYSVSGQGIALSGSVNLSQEVAQFVTGDSLLAGSVPAQQSVDFWSYPAGGAPTKTITGFTNPFGVAISPVLPQ